MGIRHKLYEDYFKNSRLVGYKGVLSEAKRVGYKMLGIKDFYEFVSKDDANRNKELILVNRHDIDTSPRIARKFFDIEKEVYGKDGSATYYFRNSTIDVDLMREIDDYGYETGYHYEEMADYIKEYKVKDNNELENKMDSIKSMFKNNIDQFRERTGSPSLTVASHGDWINVRFNKPNLEILKDNKIRDEANVVIEAYDEVIMKHVCERFADQILLEYFPGKVIEAIERKCECIMILTHPRNWEVDFIATTRENVIRISEEVKYRLFN